MQFQQGEHTRNLSLLQCLQLCCILGVSTIHPCGMGDNVSLEDEGRDASRSWAELWEGKECQPLGFSGYFPAAPHAALTCLEAALVPASRAFVQQDQLGIFPNISWGLWEGERGELQQALSALSFPCVGDFSSGP